MKTLIKPLNITTEQLEPFNDVYRVDVDDFDELIRQNKMRFYEGKVYHTDRGMIGEFIGNVNVVKNHVWFENNEIEIINN